MHATEETTAPAPISAIRRCRRGAIKLNAKTSNAALAAAIEAVVAACKAEEPLAVAHTAAEDAEQALKLAGAPETKLRAADNATERAERRWQRSYRACDRAAAAMLAVPVDNAADAGLKLTVYAWTYQVRQTVDVYGEEDLRLCLEAAQRDLKAIAKIPEPPPAPPPAATTSPDPAVGGYIASKARLDFLACQHNDGAYDAEMDRWDGFSNQLLSTPPADLQGIATRLRAIIEHGFDCFTEGTCAASDHYRTLLATPPTVLALIDNATDEGPREAVASALCILHDGVQRLMQGEAQAVATWDAAVAAYEAAHEACEANSREFRAAYTEVGAHIPDELVQHNRYGRHLRWRNPDFVMREPGLTMAEKIELKAALEAWLPRQHELDAAAGLGAIEEAAEELYDARHEALDQLLETPAPTPAALAKKMLLASIEADDEKRGFTDPAYVSQQRSSYLPNRSAVETFADACRLAGKPDPVPGWDFHVRNWIRAYEALGGGVSLHPDNRALLLGRKSGAEAAPLRAMEDALYAHTWAPRAVMLECREDGYQTRAANPTVLGESRDVWSWVKFTDDTGARLESRIHFAHETGDGAAADEDAVAAAPDFARGPEAVSA